MSTFEKVNGENRSSGSVHDPRIVVLVIKLVRVQFTSWNCFCRTNARHTYIQADLHGNDGPTLGYQSKQNWSDFINCVNYVNPSVRRFASRSIFISKMNSHSSFLEQQNGLHSSSNGYHPSTAKHSPTTPVVVESDRVQYTDDAIVARYT
jgi:hypothetical protein